MMQSYKGHIEKQLLHVIWTTIKYSSTINKLTAQMKIGLIGILICGLPFKDYLMSANICNNRTKYLQTLLFYLKGKYKC